MATDDPHSTDWYNETAALPSCKGALCVFMATVDIITTVLGFAGNGVVIWIAGFKIKKTVNSIWYLSLAVSDFLFCATLPFFVVYMIKGEWIFGDFFCKFGHFFVLFIMFCSVFLLIVISVDRCLLVMFPVWARNQRTSSKALLIVLFLWIISAGISVPEAIFIDTHNHNNITVCFYHSYQSFNTIVVCNFTFGFLIPFLIITFCYVAIIRKLKTDRTAKSKKSLRIMLVLIGTFFICWLPFHTFSFMELNYQKYKEVLPVMEIVAFTLARASVFLNPFLYAFMGRDFKTQWHMLLSKIQSAIEH